MAYGGKFNMTLKYTFYGMIVSKLSPYSYSEPIYYNEAEDVDYELDVDISFEDFFEFVKPANYGSMTEHEQELVRKCYMMFWHGELVNINALEEDESFVEYMTDRYYESAEKQCQEENE